jgi:pimeloyl-ACP methyl ester carboxylesterase
VLPDRLTRNPPHSALNDRPHEFAFPRFHTNGLDQIDVSRLGGDVLAVMTTLQIERPMLTGVSLAVQEMSYMSVRHRDRIKALIYVDAAYRYACDVPGQFEKDLPNLPSLPPAPPAARPPFTLPEAERRHPRGLPAAAQAILAGGRQFTDLQSPI